MRRLFCKSKILWAKVTKLEVEYESSLGLGKRILDEANIMPYEMVLVVNTSNGERFETHTIVEEKDNEVALYGGAAKLANVGDKLIIMSYCFLDENETFYFTPKVIKLGDNNEVIKQG